MECPGSVNIFLCEAISTEIRYFDKLFHGWVTKGTPHLTYFSCVILAVEKKGSLFKKFFSLCAFPFLPPWVLLLRIEQHIPFKFRNKILDFVIFIWKSSFLFWHWNKRWGLEAIKRLQAYRDAVAVRWSILRAVDFINRSGILLPLRERREASCRVGVHISCSSVRSRFGITRL